jgi:hypothetical protein
LTEASRYETFVSHLKNAKINPKKEVLERIAEYHYAGVDSAASNVGNAVRFYEAIKAIPDTSTKVVLEENLNLHINGPVNSRFPNILSAINSNHDLFIVKLLRISSDGLPYNLQEIELQQEKARCDELDLASPTVALCPTEVIEITYEDRKYTALVMPRCISTLYDLPRSFPNAIINQGTLLVEAVEFMHQRGIVHMDIKSDNIFVHGKTWILGDFGSSKHIGEKVTSTNLAAYVHCKIKTAQPKYDWFMLLITLLKESLPENKHQWLRVFCDEDEKYDLNRINGYIQQLEDPKLIEFFSALEMKTQGFETCEV